MSLLWLFAGVLVGLLNALAMAAAVNRLTPAVKGLYWVTGGMAARWAFIAVFLIAALRQGADAGLLAFAGLWLARWAAIAWWSSNRDQSTYSEEHRRA